MRKSLVSAESVTEGHPDKVCDQISDAILDAYLSVDRDARVAAETVVAGDTVFLAGEITSRQRLNVRADCSANHSRNRLYRPGAWL